MVIWKKSKVFKQNHRNLKLPIDGSSIASSFLEYMNSVSAFGTCSPIKTNTIENQYIHTDPNAMFKNLTVTESGKYRLSFKMQMLYEFLVITSTEDEHYFEEIIKASSAQEAREIAESELEYPYTNIVRISAWVNQ